MNTIKFISLFFGLLLSCYSENSHSPLSTKTYLALGDSYTIGESVAEEKQWPRQLVAQLNKKGMTLAPPRIIAKTGWTTDELYNEIQQASLLSSYDYVSLLIGVNNQYRGRSVSSFIPEINRLLEKAVQLSGNQPDRVFVLSIPDWGVMPFAEGRNREQISKEVDDYNHALKEACQRFNVAFFNITPISRRASITPELVASDGLHPSGKMYQAWVDTVLPFFNLLP